MIRTRINHHKQIVKIVRIHHLLRLSLHYTAKSTAKAPCSYTTSITVGPLAEETRMSFLHSPDLS